MTRALLLLTLVLSVLLASCGGPPPPAVIAPRTFKAAWQDALDQTPALLLVVRPSRIKRDGAIGDRSRGLMRTALTQAAGAERVPLDVLFDAEELIFAFENGGKGGLIVAKGVRADLTPETVGKPGSPEWVKDARASSVEEYAPSTAQRNVALFVLPRRTWVFGAGAMVPKAREAYAHPAGRAEPKGTGDALLYLRLDGPALVHAVPALTKGRLAAIGDHLGGVRVLLLSDADAELHLEYQKDEHAAWAERTLEDLFEALKKEPDWAWLEGATVKRGEGEVVAKLPAPPRLLDALDRLRTRR